MKWFKRIVAVASAFCLSLTSIPISSLDVGKSWFTVNAEDVADTSYNRSFVALDAQSAELSQLEKQAKQVIYLTNLQRISAGLSPLYTAPSITQVASTRANELTSVFDHVRPDGSRYYTALDDVGLRWTDCGENIAFEDVGTAENVMQIWLNSDFHRENIFSSDYNYMGVSLAQNSEGVYYWVQLFLHTNQQDGAYLPENQFPDDSPSGIATEVASTSTTTTTELSADVIEQTQELRESGNVTYTLNLPVVSAVSTNNDVATVAISEDTHSVTIKGIKAGTADVTILGGSESGYVIHVIVTSESNSTTTTSPTEPASVDVDSIVIALKKEENFYFAHDTNAFDASELIDIEKTNATDTNGKAVTLDSTKFTFGLQEEVKNLSPKDVYDSEMKNYGENNSDFSLLVFYDVKQLKQTINVRIGWKGDVNLDGNVSSEDAALILRESVARGSQNETIFSNDTSAEYQYDKNFADFDENGKIDAKDALMILDLASYAGATGIYKYDKIRPQEKGTPVTLTADSRTVMLADTQEYVPIYIRNTNNIHLNATEFGIHVDDRCTYSVISSNSTAKKSVGAEGLDCYFTWESNKDTNTTWLSFVQQSNYYDREYDGEPSLNLTLLLVKLPDNAQAGDVYPIEFVKNGADGREALWTYSENVDDIDTLFDTAIYDCDIDTIDGEIVVTVPETTTTTSTTTTTTTRPTTTTSTTTTTTAYRLFQHENLQLS